MKNSARKYREAWLAFNNKHRHLGYKGSYESSEGFLRRYKEYLKKHRAIYQLQNRTWMEDDHFESVVLYLITNGRQGSLPAEE